MDVHEAVDNGIRWANEVIPDWHEHVRSEVFDVSDGEHCFLGQYWAATKGRGYTSYLAASREYSGSDDPATYVRWAIDHGFSSNDYRTSDQLNGAWISKLQEKGL